MPRRKKAPVISTQDTFEQEIQSLTANTNTAKPKSKAKRKPRKTSTKTVTRKTTVVEDTEETTNSSVIKKQPTKVPSFNSYVVVEEDYNTFHLYKEFYKSRNDNDKRAGFHAGSILYRAVGDLERRCNFYLNTTRFSVKKDLKQSLIEDLEVLKKKIESM